MPVIGTLSPLVKTTADWTRCMLASCASGLSWIQSISSSYSSSQAVPLNVTRLSARVEVIQVQPLEIPAWYNFEAA